MNKIPWSESIWFFDIDDTLINTADISPKASKSIRQIFESKYSFNKAKEVQQNFNKIFKTIQNGHQNSQDHNLFDKLFSKIEFCQGKVIKKYGTAKKWSREIFIKLAADQAGLNISPKTVHRAANEYWSTLTQKVIVLPHVLKLLKQIEKHQRPIFLITSSDARLTMDQNGQFDYDPKFSEAEKIKRLKTLNDKGINFDGLSIGDPEDKPHLDFFKKGIRLAQSKLKHPINPNYCLMFGDSFAGDLQTPKEKLGFGLVVLFQKGKKDTEIIDNQEIHTGNISQITSYLTD